MGKKRLALRTLLNYRMLILPTPAAERNEAGS